LLTLIEDVAKIAAALHTGGAVVVVGAGFSHPAGMPLVAELPPLVWHALDIDSAARTMVAGRLNRPDATSKILVGNNPGALAVAFDALRAHTRARQAFQNAFAARDAAANVQFPAHDALAQLFHRGIAELVVSYNWDTLFERCYARRYGRRPPLDDVFWKPHGDAARPDLEWILPGDPGRVPKPLIEKVTALAEERPRVLVIIGYSEADERVVELLTRPLSSRWLVCRIGPMASGELRSRHSAAAVLPPLASQLAPESELPGWEYVVFGEGRDLGPAMAGRGLGPSDAAACPRLPEATFVTSQLRTSYTARLAGPPGCGKSLSAYQAARDLSLEGWEVIRLVDLKAERPDLALAGLRFRTLAVIDDAHLLPAGVLRRLEDAAGPRLVVLAVSTEQEGFQSSRGTVRVDSKRAVRVIAGQLLKDRAATLAAVRRADAEVGDARFEEPLETRVRAAVEHSTSPWQFCFVLGGGWRRAGMAADAARRASADLVLAAAAMRQLASRDARAEPKSIARTTAAAGIGQPEFDSAIHWLANERLILSASDVRCPHQRFAGVVLSKIYAGLDGAGREHFALLCRSVLGDSSMPLAGLRVLLHELRFAESFRWRLSGLLDDTVLDALLSRCWSAEDPEQRMFAALVLTEMQDFAAGWPRSLLAGRMALIGRWISISAHPSGYGLARLVNDVWNKDKDLARELCEASHPESLAALVSRTDTITAWTLGELLDRLRMAASGSWARRFVTALDRGAMLEAAAAWSLDEIDTLGHLASAITLFDDDLGLTMLERAERQFQTLFGRDAVDAFERLQDLFMQCLRVFDPLGVYKGRRRPDSRRLRLARHFLAGVDASYLARRISGQPLRDMEPSARVLAVLGELRPRAHAAAVRALDFERLDATFGDLWRDLPHDLCVFLSIVGARSGEERERTATWIRRNAARIEKLDCQLALLVPDVAIGVLERGGTVALDALMTFQWALAAHVVDTLLESRPDLVQRLLGPHVEAAATALTRDQTNTYDGVGVFLSVLRERAPAILDLILDRLSPPAAEKAWAACLSKGRRAARRAVAALIASAISHGGSLAEAARRLQARYPKTSSSRPAP
jgi:hypothetical protein